MPLPQPSTTSPGKLVLLYGDGTVQHSAGVRYLANIALPTAAEALADATALADAFKACIPTTYSIRGYRIADANGATIMENVFATAIAGTASVGSATPYQSATVTFTGRGIAAVVGERVGQTRIVVFERNCHSFPAGARTFATNVNTAFAAFAAHLSGSTRYWADFYGQKATVRSLVTVQFNARVQKKLGS